ncbi:MAG: hypothetical protein DWQ07_14625 [Chloroflexi bacterium]|nr:MAG: hypothetical protein DWQ07_14625 [Chloroflexota bacterium]MBL1195682.1 hypothetical protein [Chloroflexota bacterium]NOH12970.1 hypothetical protein [Chloroflexota bacterium]
MKVLWRVALTPVVVFILLFALGSSHPVLAQNGVGRYFSETGHWVSGEFLEYFESFPDAVFLFGYPISTEFNDPDNGVRVQYFQRARFEFHPENRPGNRVALTMLGSQLYEPGIGEVAAASAFSPACETVPDNPYGDFQICYSFLDFYKEHGGADQFGYPISDLEEHNERTVQYFEYVRIEWYPEYRPGSQITLGNLGQLEFKQRSLDPQLLEPQSGIIDELPLDLRTKAFVEKAAVAAGEEQTLFVTVHDQNLQPIDGAEVSYTVKFSDGTVLRDLMAPTDEFGISSNTFPVIAESRDIAEVVVTVNNGNLIEIIRTSFRVWW